jgi:hypothetical protein
MEESGFSHISGAAVPVTQESQKTINHRDTEAQRKPFLWFSLWLFHFSIHTAISCAPLGGRGTRLAKRCLDDPARIGGAGAPPSRRPDYFRIDPEMELLDSRENAG